MRPTTVVAFIALAAAALGAAHAGGQSAQREGIWARTGQIIVGPKLSSDADGAASAARTAPDPRQMRAAQGVMERLGVSGTLQPAEDGDRLKVTLADAFGRSNDLFRVDVQRSCTAALDAEAMRRDPGLATYCMAERLRASGQFEYVEFVLVVSME